MRALVFAVVTLFMAAGAATAGDAQAPDAKWIDASYEFKSVVEGKTVVHDFVVQNQGTADLEIKDVKTA